VGIWSKEATFTTAVSGFATINRGLNLSTALSQAFYGNADVANNLYVSGVAVPGSSFLRNDVSGTVNGSLILTNDSGLTFGSGSSDAWSFNGKTSIKVECKFMANAAISGSLQNLFEHPIVGANSGLSIRLNTNQNIRVDSRSTSADLAQGFLTTLPVVPGKEHTLSVEVNYATGLNTVILDGVTQTTTLTYGSATYAQGVSANTTQIGIASGNAMLATTSDWKIYTNGNLVSSYNGYGNTAADWEDQTGSVDATLSNNGGLFTGQGFNGHVTTWYNQTGGANAIRTVSTEQPLVVVNGSTVTDNGVPAISFIRASGHFLVISIADMGLALKNMSAYTVGNYDAVDAVLQQHTLFIVGTGDSRFYTGTLTTSNELAYSVGITTSVQPSSARPNLKNFAGLSHLGTDARAYQNAALLGNAERDYAFSYSGNATIGSVGLTSARLTGKVQEIVVFKTALGINAAEIDASMARLYDIANRDFKIL
jgi:hypothetical protein